MRVLVVGGGAREHAIAWKLAQSPLLDDLLMAPGNAGTAGVARNIGLPASDPDALCRLALDHGVDFTVVGPEGPLAEGIVDRFRDRGMEVFGPTRAAARIESSKAFAKDLMRSCGIPTAAAEVFTSYDEARAYLDGVALPVVVKADGLAAGKGVAVADTREAAQQALTEMMVSRAFGPAGDRVVIEEYLAGQEVTALAFVDGHRVSNIVAACDYKRAFDGNRGPNTGGMGAYSPPSAWTPALAAMVREQVMEPAVLALAARGTPFVGVLYAGLVLTEGGPKVLEFNCRLGDPEAQVVLPRLKGDLLEIMLNAARGRLHLSPVEWDATACVGVVLASQGYPGPYETGLAIGGLGDVAPDVLVFHAGTREVGSGAAVTAGGRVLTAVATAPTLEEARRKVYANVGRITFRGAFCRGDIAAGV